MNPIKMGIKSFPQFKRKLFNPIQYRIILSILCFLYFSFSGFSQKNKDIIPVIECVKDLSNGLYQVTFGYENPTRKEVSIDENGSIIKSNKGKKVAKGLNRFKPGTNDKVFTKEFGSKDYVEWTIISNGNEHTVIANANSAKKCAPDDGFIFPVIGNGKSNELSGNELESFCFEAAGATPPELIFQTKTDGNILKVLIEIIPIKDKTESVMTLLQDTFNIQDADFLLDPNTYNDNGLSAIDVYMTRETVCFLKDYGEIINFARPVYPASINSGGVVSQGDTAQSSNLVRESFRKIESDGSIVSINGKGIRIGVMSDSYDMALGVPQYAEQDVIAEELPTGIDPIVDNRFRASDEGRAMMQIIHDVAPGAELAFHTATASPRQFEVAFNALAQVCDIIVDDITFITEPFFGTGRISKAINDSGKFHFTSAGNLANKGYQSKFTSSTNAPVTNFIPSGSPTRAHLFGGTDYLQEISVVPGTYLIALQWKEDVASQYNNLGATEDLDIYIVDDSGRLLVGSNRVNIEGDPTEVIVFRATGTGTANILITSANGETTVPFRYIAFHTTAEDGTPDGLKFTQYFNTGAPTVSGHAMNPAPGTVTVGAVDYRFADEPKAESFSSYGGLLSDDSTVKIDLYAPDGGNTTSTTIGQDAQCDTCDKDGFLNFYGTSASAPHAAAAMALLQSALPIWYPPTDEDLAKGLKSSFTAAEALATFSTTSTGFSVSPPPGSSAGLLNTLAAFKSIAAQTAKITSLTVTSGIASADTITVSIIGDFFPSQTANPYPAKIYFDGVELTDIEVVSDTEIIATIPPFVGNPDVTFYTEPKEGTVGNGGFSEPVKVLPDGIIALNVIADNASFEYGQDISLTYTVEGLPEGVTFESLGFPEVVLNSGADILLDKGGYPIVFDYRIFPSFGGQAYDEEAYQINFISGYIDPDEGRVGYLTITKKDLTITPHPIGEPANTPFIYTYGEAIDLTLNYLYDGTGILDNSPDVGFYSVIDTSHQSDFKDGLPNKFRAVVSKFRAVVSEYDLVGLLDGGSWSASDRTIENKFRAVVSTMNIIDLETDDFTNYIESSDDFDDGTTNKFRAVVSKFRAVVSAEDLFNGEVDLSIENKFRAVVSKFRAVVSTDTIRPFSGYESVFSIIDAEDAQPEGDTIRAISNMYALNMITGLEVTPEGESHYVYPGAFLNATSANFNITYVPGSLIILPKELKVSTGNLVIPYGTELVVDSLKTSFDGWAFEGDFKESDSIVFPEGIPYYFVKIGDPDETPIKIDALKELGDYLIKVSDPQNYFITSTVADTLTIEKAILSVSITPNELIINQGDLPKLTASFGPFAYDDETELTVFSDGIPYYFVSDNVDYYNTDISGVYTVRITNPTNYTMVYNNETTLTINLINDGGKKVRTYSDCVVYNKDTDDYTVTYRYENDNDYQIYVAASDYNKLTGNVYDGVLPTTFIPGGGTFEIRFDGNQLTWSLYTYGSFNNSSVSSANQSGTGECGGKLDGAYAVGPNPVTSAFDYELTITNKIMEESDVYIYNLYGVLVNLDQDLHFKGNAIDETIIVDMFELPNDLYIVQIVSATNVRTYNIIKQE